MEKAWKQGWRRVEIESDTKFIIHVVNGVYSVSSDIEVVVLDILHLLKYMKIKFQYTCRGSNNVAHTLARLDHGGTEATWPTSPPNWLCSALLHDYIR
ncbi:hypothetical protein LIER_15880 [Lithospermum erythrorhizon]|uniref:RNase H type-1 domain-containing protein n=1 Tax=Lithospermum erythrorhizon TaxID=34254 RepID=A0AAV3Q8M0_LITER